MTGYYASLEIALALDNARAPIEGELTDSASYMDLMDLFTAAFEKALRNPEVDFADIVEIEYGGTHTVAEVKSWWDSWS
ncbi:hypothetical protein P3T27_002139 [Kitasatospora sp. MAA19]|uniref:hypothetical protein n=1 Tax=Kitasatospora sp. MAA19 TaxID=3035090 RepID=UPI0024734748|nr:hypothetical protein [Kitasatospora sp. MAA19]MDH6705429.1 hypothetical protein [Kitasatospora sp. MAA19]